MENVSEELKNELGENRANQERKDDSREIRTQFKVEVEILKEGKAGEECRDDFFKFLKSRINDYPKDLSITYEPGADEAIITCLTGKGRNYFDIIWNLALEYRENDEFVNHYRVSCSQLEEEKENPQLSYGELDLENMTKDELEAFILKIKEQFDKDNERLIKLQIAGDLIALKKQQDEQFKKLEGRLNNRS